MIELLTGAGWLVSLMYVIWWPCYVYEAWSDRKEEGKQ